MVQFFLMIVLLYLNHEFTDGRDVNGFEPSGSRDENASKINRQVYRQMARVSWE